MDLYAHDESIRRDGADVIAGVDEAGRGPLAGPVVASAVILPRGIRIDGVRDSKKVPEKERERLFGEIMALAKGVGIGIVGSEEIDSINILRAAKLAMLTALEKLAGNPDIILIDALRLESIKTKQMAIIKGDAKSASIAAASIIAKVTRDRLMLHYHSMYPQYGFDKHKGYATKFHIERIMRHGPCPIHRKSFRKVMDMPLPFEDRNE